MMAAINHLSAIPLDRNEFRGAIEWVMCTRDRFTAAQFRCDEGQIFPIICPFRVEGEQSMQISGQWKCHETHGWQFMVEKAKTDLKLDRNGLIRYLVMTPDISGIGPIRARLMTDAFGDDFERTLLDAPERIADVCKIDPTLVVRLRDQWRADCGLQHLMVQLASFGLTNHQCDAALKAFGADAIRIIRESPYRLIGKARGLGFRTVDGIAGRLDVAKDAFERIRAGVHYTIGQTLDQGDSYIERDELMRNAVTLLAAPYPRVDEAVTEMIKSGDLGAEDHGGQLLVADPKIMNMERELTKIFRQGAEPSPHLERFADARRDLRNFAPNLTEMQHQAIMNALQYRLSVITGGAGTGKTFMVRNMVELAECSGLTVILTAPTGKAAKRLEEMVGGKARTLHQLMAYNGSQFRGGMIDADIVIVDEFSMVTSELAWELLRRIDFRRTTVVIVGDHHQLPPIGAGNVLRDLVNSRAVPITLLDQVMRQAGALRDYSMELLNGRVVTDCVEGCWYVLQSLPDAEAVKVLMRRIMLEWLGNMGFDPICDAQIITPVHGKELGTVEVNRDTQRIVQREFYNVTVPEWRGDRPCFLKHDKVIQTRNNYDTGVMNGTIGYVEDTGKDGTLSVDFEGTGIVEIKPDTEDRDDLQLAYAISMHKAQGSEFPCVIPIIHQSHSYAHDRNLLYMSVTRARQLAAIVGDPWAISHCAERNRIDQRKTLLSHWLSPGTMPVPVPA